MPKCRIARSGEPLLDDRQLVVASLSSTADCPAAGLVVFSQGQWECAKMGRAITTITGSAQALLLGKRAALAAAILYVVYLADLFAGGVAQGVPREPYLAVAEILSIVGALLQVILFGAIYECAPPNRKTLSLIALGLMLVVAGLTSAVHCVQLTVGRQIDVISTPELARVFGWDWPSLLYAIELAAWHLFFGLSLLFAAPAFAGRGKEAIVRYGLLITCLLCLVGLVGPAIGNLNWRMIGAFAYGILFPIICVVIALVFRDAHKAIAK